MVSCHRSGCHVGHAARGAIGILLASLAIPALSTAAAAQSVVLRTVVGNGFKEGYKAGYGGSAGFEFPFIGGRPFFIGGRVVFHQGGTAPLPAELGGGSETEGELEQVHYGLEFGATWLESPIIIRTSGGIGWARLEGGQDEPDGEGEGESEESTTELVLSPGLLIAVPVAAGRFFLGVEAKLLRVGEIADAFALYGTLGIRLGGR